MQVRGQPSRGHFFRGFFRGLSGPNAIELADIRALLAGAFELAAMQAVGRWRFTPAKCHDKTAVAQINAEATFRALRFTVPQAPAALPPIHSWDAPHRNRCTL